MKNRKIYKSLTIMVTKEQYYIHYCKQVGPLHLKENAIYENAKTIIKTPFEIKDLFQ